MLSLVWLTPAMDRLFLEGGLGRRRFLDRLVLALDPRHAAPALGLRARPARALAPAARRGRADPAWLAALERGSPRPAVAIAAAAPSLCAT